jgi:hypothetical protein
MTDPHTLHPPRTPHITNITLKQHAQIVIILVAVSERYNCYNCYNKSKKTGRQSRYSNTTEHKTTARHR